MVKIRCCDNFHCCLSKAGFPLGEYIVSDENLIFLDSWAQSKFLTLTCRNTWEPLQRRDSVSVETFVHAYCSFSLLVSQLPGKSNPGQQVLIQGNQILHVARTLQGKLSYVFCQTEGQLVYITSQYNTVII